MVSDLLKVRANQIPNFCKPRNVVFKLTEPICKATKYNVLEIKQEMKNPPTEKSLADAKLLLIPTISILATYIDLKENGEKTGKDYTTELNLLKKDYIDSFSFALEQMSVLCP